MRSIDKPRVLLVDTSAWIALMNESDDHHVRAVEFERSLTGARIVITWGILSETYTFLRYRRGYSTGQRWLAQVLMFEGAGSLEVVYPTAELSPTVHSQLSRFSDQDLSYVDALSIATVQTRKDIDAVFAFDHHFQLCGIPVYPL
jgi:uncharacterized protein